MATSGLPSEASWARRPSARLRSKSHTATRSASGLATQAGACCAEMYPAPTRAARRAGRFSISSSPHRAPAPARLVDSLNDRHDPPTIHAGHGGRPIGANRLDHVAELIRVEVWQLSRAKGPVVLAPLGQLLLVVRNRPDVVLGRGEL